MQVFENNLSGKLAGPFYRSWGGFIEILAPGEPSAFQGGSSYGKLYIDTSEDDRLYQYLRNFTDNYIDHPEEAIAKFTLIRKGSPTEFQIIEFRPADKWNRNTGLIMWRLSEESPDNFKYIDYDTNLMFEAGDLIEMRLTAGTLNDFTKSFYNDYQERKKIVRNQEALEKDINKLFLRTANINTPSTNEGDRNDLGVAIKVVLFAPFNYPTETQWEFSEDNKTWSTVGNLAANKPYYVRFRSLSPFFTDLNMRNHIKEVLDWGEDIETITGIFGNRLTRVPDYLPRKITSLRYMFRNATSFNQDISKWDTSGVTNFEGMFEGATSFNQDISSWNTTSVLNMNRMFYGASSFNRDLSTWDGSNASNVDFATRSGFEKDTSKHPMWSPSIIFKSNGEGKPLTYVASPSASSDKIYVKEGKYFYVCEDWDFNGHFAYHPNKKSMWFYFEDEYVPYLMISTVNGPPLPFVSFNDLIELGGSTYIIPISQVITSKVKRFDTVFVTKPSETLLFPKRIKALWSSGFFNLPILHHLTSYEETEKHEKYITDLLGIDLEDLFYNPRIHSDHPNLEISTFDVSNVHTLRDFLRNFKGNLSDISCWNTSKVTNMDYAFENTSTFNQDLSKWCVPLIKTKPAGFARESPLENSPEKHPKWGTCPRGENR